MPGGNPVDDTDTSPGTGQDNNSGGGSGNPNNGGYPSPPPSGTPEAPIVAFCDTSEWSGFCEPWMHGE